MADTRTLAVDIGGTGLKLALLDDNGNMIGKRVRVPTPPQPVAPEMLIETLDTAAAELGEFDRASVGFPGAVRDGRVLTAPQSRHRGAGPASICRTALAERWSKPVRVMNDADVQGFGAIGGKGVEMVLTLGTGAGTSIFDNGRIMPHLELAHHRSATTRPMTSISATRRCETVGKKKWNRRVARVIGILRTVVNFDHLYIGGGNAQGGSSSRCRRRDDRPEQRGPDRRIGLWRARRAAARTDQAGAPEPIARGAGVPPWMPPHRSAPAAARGSPAAAPRSRPSPGRRSRSRSRPAPATATSTSSATEAEFPFVVDARLYAAAGQRRRTAQLQQALHLSRVVIVQPSVYGATIPARSTACGGSASAPAASR